jgi:hypothetical protein
MLGAEHRHQAVLRARGEMRDERDLLALQAREVLRAQDVDARQDGPTGAARCACRRGRAEVGPGHPEIVACGTGREIGERRSHERRDARTQRRHVALAVRVDAVGEEHDIDLRDGIDPDRGPGEPRVAERSKREQLASIRGERRIDVPAEAALISVAWRTGRLRHLGHHERREHARAIQLSAAQQHARVQRQVGSRAEQAGVARRATHASRRGIVHDAAKHRSLDVVARPGQRCTALGRRNARAQRRGWMKHGVLHPERLEQVPARIGLQRLAAHARDDVAEEEKVDVAVHEPFARGRVEHFLGRPPDGFLVTLEFQVEVQIGPEPGDVRQEVPDRDVLLAVLAKPRDVHRHAVGQPEPAVLDQLHHAGRGGDGLCERRDVENGVGRHGLDRRLDGPVPVRLQ